MYRAAFFDLANLAIAAFCEVDFGRALADYAQIVQIGLDAVVWAAADGELKFMRQIYAVVALVKALVKLLRQLERVDEAILARRALA